MKTTMKQIANVFILMGLLFIASPLMAQSSFAVSGKILNSDKLPVKNAKAVLIDPTSMKVIATAHCDADGIFTITDVESGEYILSVQREGFMKTQSRTIVIDHEGRYSEKNVVMNTVIRKAENELIAENN